MNETFGERLKNIRMTLGLSQGELARLTGLMPAAISHFETGSREPGLRNIIRLCKGLNCKPNALIDI